ncbi:MAG TPA: transposase [Geobacteraceae bacterium]
MQAHNPAMPRIARIVAQGIPHHVTQRGNRRQVVFFREDDYLFYLSLLAQFCKAAGTEVWAYCLMPNHVHLIMVPSTPDGLRASIAEAHRRYTRRINQRFEWRGHLWQDRFSSFPMGEKHLLTAARYIELNPIRAHLAETPQDYRWSSAGAHLAGRDDLLAKASPLLEMAGDWSGLLASGLTGEEAEDFRQHEKTGKPMGLEVLGQYKR